MSPAHHEPIAPANDAKSVLVLGAIGGGMAGLAIALGLRLDDFPPWMITVGMYKLAFIAAARLFVAGAGLGRAARGTSSPGERAREGAGGVAPHSDRARGTRTNRQRANESLSIATAATPSSVATRTYGRSAVLTIRPPPSNRST